MTWVAAAIVGGALIGGVSSSRAASTQARATEQASAVQERSAERGIEAQERMFDRQVALQEPFRQAGVNALPELVAASRYTPFGMEQFRADPGYQFRLKEGLRAVENSASARGGLLSGNLMRGLVDYGQGMGSQEFTNAFNRYQVERAARLNPLQSLAGVGQSTAANIAGQAGQLGSGIASTYGQLGQNLGANLIGAGNARASGYVGAANALTGGMGQYLNYTQNQALMNRMFPQTPVNNMSSGYF